MHHLKTIIYFYHVPKCGGTFIRKLLRDYSEHFNGCFKNFTDLTAQNQYQENEKKLISFLNEIPTLHSRYIFIHHHHRFGGMDKLSPIINEIKDDIIAQGHKFFAFTQIRDPLSFHLSQINYLAKTGDYDHDTAQPYLDNEVNHNFLSKYLLYNHPSSWKTKQNQLNITQGNLIQKLQVFDEIFIQENMDNTVSAINELLEINKPSSREKVNVGQYTIWPSDEDKQEIKRFSELDYHLFNQVRKNRWQDF